MRRVYGATVLLAALWSVDLPALAQSQTIEYAQTFHAQKLAGVVADAMGGPVAGAQVEMRELGSGRTLATVTTDPNGRFSFPNTGPGLACQLQTSAYGFNPTVIKVKLRHFARSELRILLHIAT
jgi:hypothetical protein